MTESESSSAYARAVSNTVTPASGRVVQASGMRRRVPLWRHALRTLLLVLGWVAFYYYLRMWRHR